LPEILDVVEKEIQNCNKNIKSGLYGNGICGCSDCKKTKEILVWSDKCFDDLLALLDKK
jgi:hypothetical protein